MYATRAAGRYANANSPRADAPTAPLLHNPSRVLEGNLPQSARIRLTLIIEAAKIPRPQANLPHALTQRRDARPDRWPSG
jgi:hypothetical protein